MYSLFTEKKFAVMSGLVEGNSIRSRRVTPAMPSGIGRSHLEYRRIATARSSRVRFRRQEKPVGLGVLPKHSVPKRR